MPLPLPSQLLSWRRMGPHLRGDLNFSPGSSSGPPSSCWPLSLSPAPHSTTASLASWSFLREVTFVPISRSLHFLFPLPGASLLEATSRPIPSFICLANVNLLDALILIANHPFSTVPSTLFFCIDFPNCMSYYLFPVLSSVQQFLAFCSLMLNKWIHEWMNK